MTITEKLPSRIEAIAEFISLVTEKLKSFPVKEDIFNIKLSLQEALVNAVKHGNRFSSRLAVQVSVKADRKQVEIEVVDEGQGFDFKKVADPTIKDHLKKTSGRGVFLIRNLMDEVEFFDAGRGIRMKKFLQKGGPR